MMVSTPTMRPIFVNRPLLWEASSRLARQQQNAVGYNTLLVQAFDALQLPAHTYTDMRLHVAKHVFRMQHEAELFVGNKMGSASSSGGFCLLFSAASEAVCRTLFPRRYDAVTKWHGQHKSQAKVELAQAQANLHQALSDVNPGRSFDIHSRVKTAVSSFDKAVIRKKQVHDLLALRIVLPDLEDDDANIASCLSTRSLVSSLWPESTTRFKDYISYPKPNG